jgi:hypothetical protein
MVLYLDTTIMEVLEEISEFFSNIFKLKYTEAKAIIAKMKFFTVPNIGYVFTGL